MERVGVLIERLLAQYNNNANREKLLVTAQLLLSELQNTDEEEQQNYSTVISVFYPAFHHSHAIVEEAGNETTVAVEENEVTVAAEEKEQPFVEEIKSPLPQTEEAEPQSEDVFFDPVVEIPTLALKQQEINEAIAANTESLNDRLKSSSNFKEIGSTIKTPIKDLRKAIGINDRFVFINELFRGDETMYERSIKTINSFNIFGEAELWIKRELKLKLAWNDRSETVHIFDELVKRRFS